MHDQNEVQHYSFGHMMPMAPSVAPLHAVGQDDQNEIQHVFFFGHLIPLASVSHDTNGTNFIP